jgi:hypothetical protein
MQCPQCGTTATDEDFDKGTANLDYWIDSDGKFHCECFECGNKWVVEKGEKTNA